MADWVENAIWWQVYPLGFTAAPAAATAEAAQHRLEHLTGWLDYAIKLGCSGLALGPVFAAETHGYVTVDHFQIDARLGDLADFDTLASAARQRGLRLLLDGVFNHVGRQHPAFQAALKDGPSSPTASWFRFDWPADWHPGDTEPVAHNFEGHDQLVALNHDEPEVVDYVARVMIHWLDRGVDGWRLDAAYAVPPKFWAKVLPRVRAAHPDAYIVGEVIHGDYAAFVTQAGLDAVTQYELWKAIWSAINEGNLFELAWALQRHNEFLHVFVPMTFVGNHDVTRLASRLTDSRHLPHALAVLFTVGGTPAIYYGDEQGFRGVKEDRVGGDDAVRPAFPEKPDQLAADGWPAFHLHQELIGLRRRHPWLHAAQVSTIQLTNTAFAYAATADGNRLVITLNLADEPVELDCPGVTELLAGTAEVAEGERAVVRLPAHGWAVLGSTEVGRPVAAPSGQPATQRG